MGVCKLFSGGSDTPNPMPNPKNYEILSSVTVGEFLILTVRYPECTNYEGKKVLMFCGLSREELEHRKQIDPHFSKTMYSPIARFVPTDMGIRMALKLAKELS
jgi:hypothetical protein